MNKAYLLTPAEWRVVRTHRGRNMTGQPALTTDDGKTYYWCYGTQPDKKALRKIARKCPVKAAMAYLRLYEYNPPDTWPKGYVRPVPRGKA